MSYQMMLYTNIKQTVCELVHEIYVYGFATSDISFYNMVHKKYADIFRQALLHVPLPLPIH